MLQKFAVKHEWFFNKNRRLDGFATLYRKFLDFNGVQKTRRRRDQRTALCPYYGRIRDRRRSWKKHNSVWVKDPEVYMETTTPIESLTTSEQVASKELNAPALIKAIEAISPAASDATVKDSTDTSILDNIDCPLHRLVIDLWYFGGFQNRSKLDSLDVVRNACTCGDVEGIRSLMGSAEKQMLWDELVICDEVYGLTEIGRQRLSEVQPPLHIMEKQDLHPFIERKLWEAYVVPFVKRKRAQFELESAKLAESNKARFDDSVEEEAPKRAERLCTMCSKMKSNYIRLNRPLDRFKEPCTHWVPP
jgi:hypothetical protein